MLQPEQDGRPQVPARPADASATMAESQRRSGAIVGRARRALSTRWGSFLLASGSWLLIGASLVVFITALNNRFYPPICVAIASGGTDCAYPNPPPVDPRIVLGLGLLALGVALFIVAWKVDRRPWERPREGWAYLHTWSSPLIWMATIPVVIVPLTVAITAAVAQTPTCNVTYFFGMSADCPTGAILPALVLPGLLNLMPLRWLLAANGRKRLAAITASALGIAQFGLPVISLLSQGPRIVISSFLLPPYPPLPVPVLGIGLILWLCTLISMLVIAKIPPAENRARD